MYTKLKKKNLLILQLLSLGHQAAILQVSQGNSY